MRSVRVHDIDSMLLDRNQFRILILILILCISPLDADEPNCSQQSIGNPKFHELICKGNYARNNQLLEEAIDYYEKALETPVHEALNFEVYGLLAEAYRLTGNSRKYSEFKEKFEYSLAVFVGIYKCKYVNGQFLLIDSHTNFHSGRIPNLIANEMCYAETDYLLERNGLDRLQTEAWYYEIYSRIR